MKTNEDCPEHQYAGATCEIASLLQSAIAKLRALAELDKTEVPLNDKARTILIRVSEAFFGKFRKKYGKVLSVADGDLLWLPKDPALLLPMSRLLMGALTRLRKAEVDGKHKETSFLAAMSSRDVEKDGTRMNFVPCDGATDFAEFPNLNEWGKQKFTRVLQIPVDITETVLDGCRVDSQLVEEGEKSKNYQKVAGE